MANSKTTLINNLKSIKASDFKTPFDFLRRMGIDKREYDKWVSDRINLKGQDKTIFELVWNIIQDILANLELEMLKVYNKATISAYQFILAKWDPMTYEKATIREELKKRDEEYEAIMSLKNESGHEI